MDARRAANYRSLGQVHIYDNLPTIWQARGSFVPVDAGAVSGSVWEF
jgi:hypothetical protein